MSDSFERFWADYIDLVERHGCALYEPPYLHDAYLAMYCVRVSPTMIDDLKKRSGVRLETIPDDSTKG